MAEAYGGLQKVIWNVGSNIMCRMGCPEVFITDQDLTIKSTEHSITRVYYPQMNRRFNQYYLLTV